MANRPSVPEIITVNSEALQTTIRDLLPSQNGFGSELQASNLIMPIIDLTATAEGSVLRQDLQTAFSFSNITPFEVVFTTTVLLNSPGYYRVFGTANLRASTGATHFGEFNLSDGLSSKTLVKFTTVDNTGSGQDSETFDFIVFLDAGDSLSCTAGNTLANVNGSTRQIADIDGNLV